MITLRRWNVELILMLLIPLAGCSSGMRGLNPPAYSAEVGRIEEGTATRDEMIRTFGLPASRFEQGRVEIWHLGKEQKPVQKDRLRTPEKRLEAIRYHLVVVYDDQGRVARRALLQVR